MGHIFTYLSYKWCLSEAQRELLKQHGSRMLVIPEEPKCGTTAPLPGWLCAGQMNPDPGLKGPDAAQGPSKPALCSFCSWNSVVNLEGL